MARTAKRSCVETEWAFLEGGKVVPYSSAKPDEILYRCHVGDPCWTKVRDPWSSSNGVRYAEKLLSRDSLLGI